MQRKCTLCGKTKDISEFYRRKNGPDGYRMTCKACHNRFHHPTGREKVYEPGYASLAAEIINVAVADFKKPFKFVYVHAAQTRVYDHGGSQRTCQPHISEAQPDGRGWMDFKVSRKEVLDWVRGPEFADLVGSWPVPLTVDEMRQGVLTRMGIKSNVDYCEVCDKVCDEYDNDGNCIHDECRIDREAALIDRMHDREMMK